MNVDLHCHTLASDGSLTPAQLLQLAIDQEVQTLAITDHDTLAGYNQVVNTALSEQLTLVPGVEVSSQWSGMNIHIVGLNFDTADTTLTAGLQLQAQARIERAEIIGQRLVRRGCPADILQITQLIAADSEIGRPHFAKALVQCGIVADEPSAFKRFLGAGKVGDVKTLWCEMAEAVQWIKIAGGTAVIAHPSKYKLTHSKLNRLISAFKDAGGEAVEVVTGAGNKNETNHYASVARRHELFASVGSDFHHLGRPWQNLGRVGQLPSSCEPVWLQW